MPREPWIKSPRRRQWVVTLAMLGLLGVSLGAAWAVTMAGRMPMELLRQGDITVEVPQQWDRFPRPDAWDWLVRGVVMVDPESEDRSLLVGEMVFDEPQRPRQAVAHVAAELLEPSADELLIPPTYEEEKVAVGPLTGIIVRAVGRRDMRLQEHYLAVLSSDGRRYVVLYLLTDLRGEDVWRSDLQRTSGLLFISMLRSVRTDGEGG